MTFEEFAATRLPALLKFAAVLAGDRATAEDLSQEVLARAYTGWDRIGGLDRPDLYVRKMLLNEFLSWRRRSWRLVPSADPGAGRASAVPDHAYQHSERAALLAEIGKLPRQQRAVLVLRYYEGLADHEIAALLSCREASVRSLARRGLTAMRPLVAAASTEGGRI
jgi:RNA polymerase sigma-70 factor (sigma-E family)